MTSKLKSERETNFIEIISDINNEKNSSEENNWERIIYIHFN